MRTLADHHGAVPSTAEHMRVDEELFISVDRSELDVHQN